jgi:hypothetical protein
VLALMPNQRSLITREGVPHITPADALVGLVFLVWVIDVIAARRVKSLRLPPLEPVLYAAWAVVAAAAVLLKKQPTGECVKEAAQLGVYFVVAPALFADLLSSPSRLRSAGLVVLGSGTVIALIALAQGLKGPLLSPGSADRVQVMQGLFENNHVLSCYLAMLAPLCVGAMFFWPGWPVRIWAGALAVLCLVLTMNGGLLAALAIAALAAAAARGRRHLAGTACAIFLLTAVILPCLPKDRGSHLSGSVSVFTGWHSRAIVSYRYRRAQAGVNIFRAHPFIGVGPGRFQDFVGKQIYHMLDDELTPTPTPPEDVTAKNKFVDNRYVLTSAELGLPGLAILLAVMFLALRRLVQALARAEDDWVKGVLAGCIGMVIAAMIGGIFTDFLVRGLALPFIFAISVGFATPMPRTSPPSEAS